MLGADDAGELTSRERGNSIAAAAAKECNGVTEKSGQEKSSADVTSAVDQDKTIVQGDTEHGRNSLLQLRSTARDRNMQGHIGARASIEVREARKGTFPLEPPVTKDTLNELDVLRIIWNPKLRHDINFDPDLHFRPNLDGEKGRRKAERAAEFWNCLRSQLRAFMEDRAAFESQFANSVWCLPLTLKAIGEILGTLVPPEDRSVVEESLNVDHLMQQFSKGVGDLERLARWLSKTLKTHCAPMRDEWVDEMVNQLVNGNRYRDTSMLVQGLQTLLGVLEAMRLDVANHQIRCLRPILIEDTIGFQQKYFLDEISHNRVNVMGAYRWFRAANSLLDHSQTFENSLQGDMWAFFKSLTNLILPSRVGTRIPDTFVFDEERITKLRSDVLDAVNLEVCVRIFRELYDESHAGGQSSPSPMVTSALPVMSSESHSLGFNMILLSPSGSGRSKSISKYAGRCVKTVPPGWVPVFGIDPYASLCPAGKKNYSIPSAPPALSPIESRLSVEESFRSSILAIIEDTPGENRWTQNCSPIALQILRSCPNLRPLPRSETKLEKRLQFHLSNSFSSNFLFCESYVLSELYPLLLGYVTRYAQLTLTQLFEVAAASRNSPFQQSAPCRMLQDISKQIAHIGILHWRVWAPLAYLVDPDTDDPSAINLTTDGGGRESTLSDRNSQKLSNETRQSPTRRGSISESIRTQS